MSKINIINKDSSILIVDDNPNNLQVLGQIVKSLGSKIAFAKAGKDALEYLKENNVDIVLLDIMMPGMDGYEVCREIKSNPETCSITVIFITAMSDSMHEKKGFELGAVDYISKPFNPEIVKARVLTHLTLKRKTDLLEQLAGLDGLTDIPNRRSLNHELIKEIENAFENNGLFSFVMLDIDNFKNYNDNYGHSAGDFCLRSIAAKIRALAIENDGFAARFGGEEFAVILRGKGGEAAVDFGNSLRERVEDLKIEHGFSDVSGFVTISIGIATIELKNLVDEKIIIDTADEALYSSKKNGKNRVTHKSLVI